MAEVVLKEVWKTYSGDIDAVKGVSFTTRDGELLVLVGPSGCGKSTTLRLIAGLEEPSSGEISIDGRVVNGVPPRERDVAMVFQNYALYPHMTVYDNMAFSLKLRGYPKQDIAERIRWAANLLGIESLLDRKPRALSGGERQRVALGRAIVRKPKVFLFDEPLSNLDAKLRVETRAELKRLHQNLGITTIYVTHDQVEAMTLGDRIAVMKGGEIQQIATPQCVYDSPSNLFVAGFVGTPPMNFIPGEIESRDSRVYFRHAAFELEAKADLPTGRAILGVRPENLRLDPGGSVRARVTVVEPLGSEVVVYASLLGPSGEPVPGEKDITARLEPGSSPKVEETVRFRIDVREVHFFDSESGENLCLLSAQHT